MPLFSSKFLKHCILGPLTDIYEVTKHAAVLDPLSRAEEGEPVLLSSVSPSLFVVLGAVSASVILLTVVMAALYVRYVVELQTNEGLRLFAKISYYAKLALSHGK